MSVNHKDPPVELVPNPVALDAAVQIVQEKLAAGLPWLQKAFGRARKMPAPVNTKPQDRAEAMAGGRDQVVPEVYYRREPYDCRPNDNLQSYCFFYPRDPVQIPDYDPAAMEAIAEQQVSIIFWINLQRVDPERNYDFGEELRRDVLVVLRQCLNFKVEELYNDWDNVFEPFAVNNRVFKQYLKPPYAGFRIDGILTYDAAKSVECPPEYYASTGDDPGAAGGGGGGTIPPGTDMSHIELEVVAPPGGIWILTNFTFAVGNGAEPSRFVWGDGVVEDTPGNEGFAALGHFYDEGTYTMKFYPVAGLELPAVNAVASLYEIDIQADTSGGQQLVRSAFNNSITACTALHWLVTPNLKMDSFPRLPYGPQQVSLVRVPNSLLDGAAISNILIDCDGIGWEAGELDVTGNPGVNDLTVAGAQALANLQAKFWTLTGF